MIRLFSLFLLISGFGNALAQNYCLRFYGHGTGDIDRVKIPIDNPERPVDVGHNFTVEFEMLATLSDNPMGGNAQSGFNDDWTLCHVIVDRDIFGNGDYGDYGISLCNGRIAFGVNNGTFSYTIISNAHVADSQWHHIAITREAATGAMRIFTDGVQTGFYPSGPTGNISYRNNRQTSWPNDPFIVLGAEKHDYDPQIYPSFNGFLDELRISSIVRYSSNYTPVNQSFITDSFTVGLYHFDEGTGTVVSDFSNAIGGPSNGQINFGGSGTPGPVWVLRSPGYPSLGKPPILEFFRSHGKFPVADSLGRQFLSPDFWKK